jgi:general secretion pathway protein G
MRLPAVRACCGPGGARNLSMKTPGICGDCRRKRRAFTLIELLTVLVIVAALTALVAGAARRAVEVGRIARARSDLAAITLALESYRRVYGDYPQTDDGTRLVQSLLGQFSPTGIPLQDRPLLESDRFNTGGGADSSSALIDPWGRPYVYLYKVPPDSWTNPAFVLYSVGPDGRDTPASPAGDESDPTLPGNADNIFPNRP